MTHPASGFRHAVVSGALGLCLIACSGETTGGGGSTPTGGGPMMPPGTSPGGTGAPAPGGGDSPPVGAPAPPAVAGSLPCEVAAIVKERCSQCHGVMPLFGAPMPLITPEDFRVASKDGRRKVAEVANRRILDETMPPKSAPQLTAEQRMVLAAWLDQGAPAAAPGPACADGPLAPPDLRGPQLDCKPDYVFTAHGADPAAGYPVPVEDNHYQCFNMPSPFQPQEQAVAHAPIIGDARVIHHWILYVVKGTSSGCNQLKRFLMGWAPGQSGAKMPPDIGLELPNADERLLLEIHYNNPQGIRDIQDKTGVAICTTKTPRPIEAGVLTLGSMGIKIPPRAKGFAVTGNCDPFTTGRFAGPVNVLASWPHMHRLGSKFSSTIRGMGRTDVLVDVQKWDFNDQIGYPGPTGKNVINRGDSVTTVCTYDNDQDHEVRFGENTENEMCFNFMTVYPVSAIRVLDSVPLRMCSALTDRLGGL
jgi:hypothetical protein